MRIIIKLLFLFIANSVFSKDVTIIVDYTIDNNRIETLKKTYRSLINKKNKVVFQYLGGETFNLKAKPPQFNAKCGFVRCNELEKLLPKFNNLFITTISGFSFCESIKSNYIISDFSKLSKTEKRDYRKSERIIILDIKGGKDKPLPDLIISSSKTYVKAGENIQLIVAVDKSENINIPEGKLQWYINSEKIEGEFKAATSLDTTSKIKCIWSNETCTKESNELTINVEQCSYKIPYSLFFDIPEIYGKDPDNPNINFIYPMDDSDQHRVLFIKQKCFFKDYIIEFFDKDNNLLKEEEIEINEEKSQYFLMNLDLDIKDLKGINVSDIIPKGSMETILFVRITPKKLNPQNKSMPKYSIYFTSCRPD